MIARTRAASGRWWATLGLGLVVALHLVGGLPFQDALRMISFDLYESALPKPAPARSVLIVGIDEASLERYGQWPWPRTLLARLLDRIAAARPTAVGIHFLLPEPDQFSACEVTRYVPSIDPALVRRVCALPSNDAVLAASLRRARSVLGTIGEESASHGQAPTALALAPAPVQVTGEDPRARLRHYRSTLVNLPLLEASAAGRGLLNTESRFGVTRKVPMLADVDGTLTPSLSLEMARMVFGGDRFVARGGAGGLEGVTIGDRFVPTQEDGTVWIRRGAHDPERFVSAAFVLDAERAPSLLRGKLVIVDLIARGQSGSHGDASDARVAPGEVQAEVLESVVTGTTLVRPRWALWIEGALMACVGLAISWVFPWMRKRALLPLLVLTMAGIWLCGLAAYAQARLLLDVLSPISIVFVMFFLMLADSLVREEATRHSLAERLSDEERHRRLLEGDLESQREQAAKARGEMEAATRIQRGMLPDVRALFSSESRLDVAALMNPARHVGGDLYDCFMLDEHRAFFVVGDVCGKGIPASLFMAICKTLCKSLALRYASLVLTRLNPGTLVRQLNQEIARDNPEEFFVTGFFAVLDLRSGDLSYCNAGHDNPFVCSRSHPPRELDGAKGPPVCILDDYDYPTHHDRLLPGDVLCVYTDGVTEAFDPQQREYGKDRLLRVLSKQWDRVRAQEILDATCESVRAFTSGADPSDDLTMLVLRWSP